MQIMFVVPDEELQERCKRAEQNLRLAQQAATADGVTAIQAASHYNPTDQARRMAAYKDLRAQDEADLVFLVRLSNCGPVFAECMLKAVDARA
jgi:thioredoxin-like negative regulator of GroEL